MNFVDGESRKWVVKFDFGTLCRIEDDLGYKILDNPTDLPTSPRAYVEMTWVCIEKQAKELGVSPEDFGSSIDGPAFDRLQRCFFEELAVFFEAPKPGASALIRKAISLSDMQQVMMERVIEQAYDEASSKLQALSASSLGDSQLGS